MSVDTLHLKVCMLKEILEIKEGCVSKFTSRVHARMVITVKFEMKELNKEQTVLCGKTSHTSPSQKRRCTFREIRGALSSESDSSSSTAGENEIRRFDMMKILLLHLIKGRSVFVATLDIKQLQ